MKTILHRNYFFCLVLSLFLGCQSTREYTYVAQDYSGYEGKTISGVTLKDGSEITFAEASGRYYEDHDGGLTIKKIIGFDEGHKPLSVPLERVLEVQCHTVSQNTGGTIITVLLVTGTVLFILLIVALSNTHFN